MITSFFKTSLLFLLLTQVAMAAPMDKAQLEAPLPRNLWKEMSRITQPGVVGIYLDIDVEKSPFRRDPFFEFLEEFLGEALPNRPNPQDSRATPIGTGFLIDKEGHIVTNYHVVGPLEDPRFKTKLQVQVFGEEDLLPAELVGRDSRGDIALLRVTKPIKNPQPLEFGDSDSLAVGEFVAAFGNPYGHSNSMTVGILSAKGRAIKEINRFPFLQTDASINPGNSGGPLLNTQGYVIGVNTAIDARAQGIGFAIPANYVKKVVEVLKSGGTIQRAFLGVGLAPVNPRYARSRQLPPRSAVVTQVEPQSPADKGGIKTGDVIVEFSGEPVQGTESLISQIQDSEVGQATSIKLLRPGTKQSYQEKQVDVELSQFPDPVQLAKSTTPPKKITSGQEMPYDLGFQLAEDSPELRLQHQIPDRFATHPVVVHVSPRSPARLAGLRPGDMVLEVNGKKTNSVSAVLKAIQKGENRFVLRSKRGHKVITIATL
jgi:serine protease Do